MGQITWKNINAPDFSAALYSGQRASEQMGKALDPLKTILTDAQARDEANFKNAGEQTTQGLAAQFRNTGSIDELDQLANPEALQAQYGVLANQDRLRAAAQEQEGLIRNRNTDELLAGTAAPGSHGDIQALLHGKSDREFDLDRINKTWTGLIDGQRKDEMTERDNKAYLKEQEGIAEAEDIKQATNGLMASHVMGVPFAEGIQTALDGLNEKTDKVKARAALNAAVDLSYDLTADVAEALGDYDNHTNIERARVEQTAHSQVSAAQTIYDHAVKAGVSPSTHEEASDAAGGSLQHINSIVGNRWFRDGGIGYLEDAQQGLRSLTNEHGIQLYTEQDINAITMQAWNNTAKGKGEGWFSKPKVTNEVLAEMSRLSQALPKQRAAAAALQDVQQQAQDSLYAFELGRQANREGLRDSLRSGKPAPPTDPASQIMAAGAGTPQQETANTAGVEALNAAARNAQPSPGISAPRQAKMDNNRPTVNGQKLPEGASAREFIGAWTQKVNEVLGTSEAFAGTPAEAVEQAMVATPIIETNNGENLGNNPNTVGIVQMQEARRKDLGLTKEEAADPVIALRAQEKWYKDVAVPALEKAGLPVNPTNLFMTHNQGATGGVEILLAAQAEDAQAADTEADYVRAEELAQIQAASDEPQSGANKRAEEVLRKHAAGNTSGTAPIDVGSAIKNVAKSILIGEGERQTKRGEQMAAERQKRNEQKVRDRKQVSDFFAGLSDKNQAKTAELDQQKELDKLDRQLLAGTIDRAEYRKKYDKITKTK